MAAATISPTRLAPPAGRHWGPDQMIGTNTPSGEADKSRFRMARERRELTQQQVADRCELSLKTIKRYDAGGRPRSIEIAQRLAEVLDQPLHWLWPPDDHLQVRVARANHPDAAPSAPPATPDPHEVLATLDSTRPRLQRRARWLASGIAFATAAVAATAVVLATTGHGQRATPPTNASARGGIAPILTPAAPPLLAASAAETTDDQRAAKRDRNQRAHAPRRHHRSAPSQRPATHSSGGSTPPASARTAQPTSTTQQTAATTTTVSAPTPASSTPAKRQRADAPSSGGGEFLP